MKTLARYTLSSWAHKCPVWNSVGNLVAATFPGNNEELNLNREIARASGCLIDALLFCNAKFPQDDTLYRNVSAEETPCCFIGALSVTLLKGIEADPMMLAAYAGIATQNEGLNSYFDLLPNHRIAVNSIGAAYTS